MQCSAPKAALLAFLTLGAAGITAASADTRLWPWKDKTPPDPALAISRIAETAGGAIGVVNAVLLVAFVVHRRRGN